jgi:hypothetical protein
VDLRFRFDRYDGCFFDEANHDIVCQQKMVDYIMTVAYPYIHKIKKVSLTGFVRKISKEKWESILRQAYFDIPYDYDHDAELAAMCNIPSSDL